MKNFLKISTWTIVVLATFASSKLSAWWDPTGTWGRSHPCCYYNPTRGLYTVRAELLYLRSHVDNVKVNKAGIQNSKDFQNIPGLLFFYTNDERKRRFKWRYGFKIGL